MFRNVYRKPASLVLLSLVWIGGAGYGMRILSVYANTPGPIAAPPAGWPAQASFRPAPDRPVLLVFAHPRCPCSRSAVGELARIAGRNAAKASIFVFFYYPPGEEEAWAKTDLWESAAAIPGVRAMPDRGGAEARAFGASTSGQTLLYDPAGRLIFSGGITAARGHSGDNAGEDAVLALLSGAPIVELTGSAKAAVFGCSLRGAE